MSTRDGGASWQLVASDARTPSGWLGTSIAATGEATVWAAAIVQETGTQPQLAFSVDSGATWSDAALPGLPAQYSGSATTVVPVGPPVIEGMRGAFAAYDTTAANHPVLRAWQTSDGGVTWREVSNSGASVKRPIALAGPDTWVGPATEAAVLSLTSNAGGHWTPLPGAGLPTTSDVFYIDSPDGHRLMATLGVLTPSRDIWLIPFLSSDSGATWRIATFGT